MKPVLKNKGTIVPLLIVTVGIWGGIVYRIAEYSNREQVQLPVRESVRIEKNTKEDSLLMDYRDPFLGSLPSKPVVEVAKARGNRTIDEPGIPPPFRFAGRIKKGKRESLVIITGGEIRLIPVRERFIDGYRIDRIDTDSLCVSRGKHKYTLRME